MHKQHTRRIEDRTKKNRIGDGIKTALMAMLIFALFASTAAATLVYIGEEYPGYKEVILKDTYAVNMPYSATVEVSGVQYGIGEFDKKFFESIDAFVGINKVNEDSAEMFVTPINPPAELPTCKDITISSDPSGAVVESLGLYFGETPVLVTLCQNDNMILVLTKDGYESKYIGVTFDTGDVSVVLIPKPTPTSVPTQIPTPEPTSISTPMPEPIPEYKSIEITSEPAGAMVSTLGTSASPGICKGTTPLAVKIYPGENLSLLLTNYGYLSEIVTLDYETIEPSLNVKLKPESWRIMDFLEVGKITQEGVEFTLIYKGKSYVLDQNASDGNRHTVPDSDMKITSRSDRWELETSEGISLFEKIENASEDKNIWHVTVEVNNKEKIKYSYGVFVSESGESVTVLKEANMTFRFSSSNGESNAGVLGESGISEFFISITYDFVNNTRVFMETSETARAEFAQPLVDWMNETMVPGLDITLIQSMGMMEIIPLEGTVVSASGKVLTKIPAYMAKNPTAWYKILFKQYQESKLIFRLEEEGSIAGKAIVVKSADWGPIFKKIDADREAAGLIVIRESPLIAKDDVVVLLPYPEGKFWEYIIGLDQKSMFIYIEKNTKK